MESFYDLNNKGLITELKYYQMYIGEIISDYEINERICDLFDTNKVVYAKYGNCLGHISTALVYRQYMLCCLMFCEDKDSKSIQKLCNTILDTKVVDDKDLHAQLKKCIERLKTVLDENKSTIDKLYKYRCKIYAHWDKKVFDSDWQKAFVLEYKFDYEAILKLCNESFDTITNLLELLGEGPYTKSITPLSDIDKFINSFKI